MAAVVYNEDIRRLSAASLRILAVSAAYYAASEASLLQRVLPAGVVICPFWPPTGVSLACLLLLGPGIWPGIALGHLAASVRVGLQVADIGIVCGNTLAPVCAYLLLRRAGFRTEMDRLRDGLTLVFLGAMAAMLISATVGAGSLALTGALPKADFWPAWSAWWTGDALGVLVVTPLLLLASRARWPRSVPFFRWTEATLLLTTTTVVTLLATRTTLHLLFLIFPALIWAALRFQLAGAAPCALIVSVIAVTAATHHTGPFAGRGLLATMVTLQALNGSVALTALLLAAVTTERNNAYLRIKQACKTLTEVVARLSPNETTGNRPPPEEECP
ncbi:MASE1 domain-containing protein [Streptomyces sp. UNOB3_S3]|uniref:MASE1 domain-containing protein n=1 Tax=Streptomyces sp. UNOB3_S3 TaxID=2871682 RepID=UPI001E48090F|nr:MASE1 domain-containing protein [Streptomyces sp. UNOB3_S3]MCC3777504.1 MASE1 domain-containing protein [Streptomyces sp. UNOB3_S3]